MLLILAMKRPEVYFKRKIKILVVSFIVMLKRVAYCQDLGHKRLSSVDSK